MSAVGASGSALDVATLVQQLVAADRAPHNLRLNRIEAGTKAKLSALAGITAALDGLKRSLASFSNSDAFDARSATPSGPDALTATAASGTPAGRYAVEVLSLSSAHKLVSGGFAAAASLGSGRISVTVGTAEIQLDISADQTVADIRSAIQAAADAADLPLDATVVRGDDGEHLVLSAAQGGAAQSIRVRRLAGDATLDALVYDPGTLTSLTEAAPARDAQVRIDGVLRSSSSNRIDDAAPGLSLVLKTAAPGTVHTVAIDQDGSAARKAVESFVTAYNAAMAAMASATRYDPATRQAAALTGDGLVRGAMSQLRSTLGEALAAASEAGLRASDMGLATRTDGTLSFDGGKFENALATSSAKLRDAFSGGAGIVTRLATVLASLTGTGTPFAERTEGLNKQLRNVADQRAALDERMAAIEARYRAQYTALDSLLAQLQSTSSFIAQQLGSS